MSNIQKAVAELLNYPKAEIFKTFAQKTSESELITDWNISNRKTYSIQDNVYDKNYDLMIEAQGLFCFLEDLNLSEEEIEKINQQAYDINRTLDFLYRQGDAINDILLNFYRIEQALISSTGVDENFKYYIKI